MRPLVALVLALLASLTTRAASAMPLCDPAGRFCIQVDTTSAIVCTPLRPGGLTTATCVAADADARKLARRVDDAMHGAMRLVDSLVVRFDDWTVTVTLARRPAEPEVSGDGGAREATSAWTRLLEGARPAGWLAEEVAPPTLSRINGVQVARSETRMSSAGIGGAVTTRNITYDVRARDVDYLVMFDTDEREAARLTSMANTSLATLDALPVKSATGPGDALVWLLRGVVAALVLVGLAWLVGRRKGRRGGMDSRDLWPR
jgi:hypothetical protein